MMCLNEVCSPRAVDLGKAHTAHLAPQSRVGDAPAALGVRDERATSLDRDVSSKISRAFAVTKRLLGERIGELIDSCAESKEETNDIAFGPFDVRCDVPPVPYRPRRSPVLQLAPAKGLEHVVRARVGGEQLVRA